MAIQKEAPNASIIFVHGVGEHMGRYRDSMEYFANCGFSCFSYDQRGFGDSQGSRAHVTRFSQYVEDLTQFVEGPVRATSSGGLFVLGHSMGAMVALLYAMRKPENLVGLLVLATPLILANAPSRWSSWLAPLLSRLAPKLPLINMIDSKELSHDTEVVEKYENDLKVVKTVTASWLREFGQACQTIIKRSEDIKVPILICHGTADEVADNSGSQSLYKHVGSRDKSLRLYEGLRHELMNEKEPERSRVLKEISEWLISHSSEP